MIFTISVVQRANIHIEKSIEWCAEQTEELSVKFIESLNSAMKDIQKNPLKYQIRYENEVRIKFLKYPKFGVHYIVRNHHIYVVGVFHTNQDSESW